MTHSTSSSEACSLVIRLGIAMLTIVRSSRVMKNPSETTINTAQGFAWNFRTISPCLSRMAPQALQVLARRQARHGGRALPPAVNRIFKIYLDHGPALAFIQAIGPEGRACSCQDPR